MSRTRGGRPESEPEGGSAALEALVAAAQAGDASALGNVVSKIQADVYRLAVRFLWHPQDAEDATQDILIRVITRLGSFRGESAFRTWVYRVATNALLTMKKGQAEQHHLSFDEFADDLTVGLSTEPLSTVSGLEESLLLEEVKIGCTTAMLLCLDRAHRMAYVLGEIVRLDHRVASEVLEITPSNYRKRLSRAREQITSLMQRRCGLFDPRNECRCRKRVARALELGRVDPDRLLFATSREKARLFPEVLDEIRRLEELERAAALYRSHPEGEPAHDLGTWLKELLARGSETVGRWAELH